jgi:CRISPR-associated protein (Cas_Cas02710)
MYDRNDLYNSIRNAEPQNFALWQTNANKVAANRIEGSISYFKDFFPLSLRLFKAVLEKQKQKDGWSTFVELADRYDALISIVGYSPEPLLHTICSLSPMKVYPVITDEIRCHYTNQFDGKDLNKYFSEWINDDLIKVQKPGRIVSSIDSLDTFRRVKEIVTEIRNDKFDAVIAIDVTGGKKSSVVTAFILAAIEFNIDIFYVDFEKYDGNKAFCGTEFLNKLENPYDIYNIQLLNQAKELFRNHNYQAAFLAFDEIKNKILLNNTLTKYSLTQELNAVKKMRQASRCYMHWDRYSFELAYQSENCLNELQKKHLENLRTYDKYTSKVKRYKSNLLYSYILDRILSAKRRWFTSSFELNTIHSDNLAGYHDAMLRYFQCVEIIMVAYITKNETDFKYDPDSTQNPLKTVEIRNLCFKGVLLKKIKDKNRNESTVQYTLKSTLKPSELKGKITDLTNRRDEFVHVKSHIQSADIFEAELLVKKLMKQVFQKNDEVLNNDLNEYAFKSRFDNEGNLI